MMTKWWLSCALLAVSACHNVDEAWLALTSHRPAAATVRQKPLFSLRHKIAPQQPPLRLTGGSSRSSGLKRQAHSRRGRPKSWWSMRLKEDDSMMAIRDDGGSDSEDTSRSSASDDVEELEKRLARRKRKRRRRKEDIQWLASSPEGVNEAALVAALQTNFGLDSFRGGQLAVIKRVVSGQSSLLIAATGSGKSLVYLLPAILLPGVSIVVSPLLALIQDQLLQLPGGLRGATLSSQMNRAQQQEVIDELKAGTVKILFVAPERLFTDAFQELAASLPVNFAAVDEAHCVSEWAHHFRPAYLRLRRVLTDKIGVQCVVGLTATATVAMQHDLQRVLQIPAEGTIRTGSVRNNLDLSVVTETRSVEVLLRLLRFLRRKMEAARQSGGVIVYCSFQRSCDEIASMLCSSGIAAARYHAGCGDEERRRTQDLFLRNRLEVVVATVAFGLGVNKPDVRAVVHFNCPSSVEEYVQQVGRAGRDGQPSYGVLFLQSSDFVRLRSLAHSHSVEDESVVGLVRAVLIGGGTRTKWMQPARSSNASEWQDQRGPWESIITVPDSLCRRLDLFPETVETILSFMDEDGVLTVLPKGPASVTVTLPSTGMDEVENDNVLGAIVEVGRKVGRPRGRTRGRSTTEHAGGFSDPDELGGRYTVDVNKLCRAVGMSYLQVTRRLKQLDEQTDGVEVESQGRSWRVQLHKTFHGNVTALGMSIAARLRSIQTGLVAHVDDLHQLLQSAPALRIALAHETLPPDHPRATADEDGADDPTAPGASGLQAAIHAYFQGEGTGARVEGPRTALDVRGLFGQGLANASVTDSTKGVLALLRTLPVYMEQPSDVEATLRTLREDVVDLLQRLWGATRKRLSPLAITRILHGISSPAFPAHWATEHAQSFWGLHSTVDWHVVLAVAEHMLAQPDIADALRVSRAPRPERSSQERDFRLMAWFEAADNSSSAPKRVQSVVEAAERDARAMELPEQPRVQTPDGFQGEHKGGLRWGLGVQRWRDGTLFEGDFERDACHGHGRFVFADESVYEGEVAGGRPEGWGLILEATRLYRGAWHQGLPHGQGLIQDVRGGELQPEAWLVQCDEGRHLRVRLCTGEDGPASQPWMLEVAAAVQKAKESARRAREALGE